MSVAFSIKITESIWEKTINQINRTIKLLQQELFANDISCVNFLSLKQKICKTNLIEETSLRKDSFFPNKKK